MKGKDRFMIKEWMQIIELIRKKMNASTKEQRIIRNQIRALGFYFSDFSNKKGYTYFDAEELTQDGKVIITDNDGFTLKERIFQHPEILQWPTKMDHPNDPILIHKGRFKVEQKAKQMFIDGSIYFKWLPKPRAYFSGVVKKGNVQSLYLFGNLNSWQLLIEGTKFGDCYLTSADLDNAKKIEGYTYGITVRGDRSVPLSTFDFAIANMRELYGSGVRATQEGRLHLRNNRITLNSSKCEIIIDKASDYDRRKDELESQGGYILQYAGRLQWKKGSISFDEMQNIFIQLNTFLSFINGRRVSAMMITGVHIAQIIYQDATGYSTDTFEYVRSWTPHSLLNVQTAWEGFSTLWTNADHKDFLETAIHWYVEANAQAGYIEGSIIMAQTALELIYNWLIIEQKKLIVGEDGKSISASNKLRLLISIISVSPEIPTGLKELTSYASKNKAMIDGPETIVQLRNAIVHGQLEKRKSARLVPIHAKLEALNLCLWYIELSLLFILGYKGKYANRCTGKAWVGASDQDVPWM